MLGGKTKGPGESSVLPVYIGLFKGSSIKGRILIAKERHCWVADLGHATVGFPSHKIMVVQGIGILKEVGVIIVTFCFVHFKVDVRIPISRVALYPAGPFDLLWQAG